MCVNVLVLHWCDHGAEKPALSLKSLSRSSYPILWLDVLS